MLPFQRGEKVQSWHTESRKRQKVNYRMVTVGEKVTPTSAHNKQQRSVPVCLCVLDKMKTRPLQVRGTVAGQQTAYLLLFKQFTQCFALHCRSWQITVETETELHGNSPSTHTMMRNYNSVASLLNQSIWSPLTVQIISKNAVNNRNKNRNLWLAKHF